MEYTEKQWQQCKEDVAKLRRELKALNKLRAELTVPTEKEEAKKKARELQHQYDEVLQRFNDMKQYLEWSQSAQRELATIGIDE